MNFNFESLKFENLNITPTKVAFACSNGDISWNELKELSDKIKGIFQSINLPQGHPVIIYGHKEKLFPAAMLACYAHGVPYIPVDVVMPAGRLQKISVLSGSQVIINCTETKVDITMPLHIENDLTLTRNSNIDFSKAIYTHSSGPIAYIMFTSGSTGEPKGVMIPLEAVNSYIEWYKRDFTSDPDTVYMNQAPFSFDLSLLELFGTFALGATSILNDDIIIRNMEKFVERLQKYKCTYWNSTPSFVHMCLTAPSFSSTHIPSLKSFLLIGEEFTSKLAKRLLAAFPDSKIINAYGPTEATIMITAIDIDRKIIDEHITSLPIGLTAKFDGDVLIQNESGNAEEEGEIAIAGDQVAVGYLNRPDLTADKFFTHKNKRAYKTGDYGYIKNGVLFFSGRRDEQVKLNGYRIEIGEISKCLEDIDFISQAITVPLKAGTQVKKIVSFVKIKSGHTTQNTDLKIKAINVLRGKLPEYMVPSDIIFVDEFPVNFNHKVDKNKLVELYYK